MPGAMQQASDPPLSDCPVVVFRSSDPIEAGQVASALQDAGITAWLHDDPAALQRSVLEPFTVSLGQPSCVSVPGHDQARALSVIGSLRPDLAVACPAEMSAPYSGVGQRPALAGRVLAWAGIAVALLGLVFTLREVFRAL